jgi:hypothetical protein
VERRGRCLTKVVSRYLYEGTGENHEKCQCHGRDSNQARSEDKSEGITFEAKFSVHYRYTILKQV